MYPTSGSNTIAPHVNPDGYILFRNSSTNQVQMQDPHLSQCLTQIGRDFDRIVYTTYRLAAKISALARDLNTCSLPFSMVTNIMDRHRLRHTDNARSVRPGQLIDLLHDIFFAASKMELLSHRANDHSHPAVEALVDQSIQALSNLMWNVFDTDRRQPLSVLQIKQTFLLICKPPTHYERIVHEHFLLASDHNGCVSQLRFESLVANLAALFRYLDSVAGRQHFPAASIAPLMHSSFALCPGPVGLNRMQFYALWAEQPSLASGRSPFSNYTNVLMTVVRMEAAKAVQHLTVACAACGAHPICGLLFKCLQCRKVAVCFKCFASRAKLLPSDENNRHSSDHRMEEITSSSLTDSNRSGASRCRVLFHKLCDFVRLCPRTRAAKNVNDSTHNATMETHVMEDCELQSRLSHQQPTVNISAVSAESYCLSSAAAAQIPNLGSMIETLSAQNAKLDAWMNRNQTQCTFIQQHRCLLSNIVQQLHCIQNTGAVKEIQYRPHSSSTPYGKHPLKLADAANNGPLSNSIDGADINRTYCDANQSDISISELSKWYHPPNESQAPTDVDPCAYNDMDISNFRLLLHSVRNVIDDSYSDNTELCKMTNQLERVLDQIIGVEEQKRAQSFLAGESIRV